MRKKQMHLYTFKAFCFFSLLVFLCSPVLAQGQNQQNFSATEQSATSDDLSRLIDVLEDKESRAKLVSQIRALIAAQKATGPENSDPVLSSRISNLISDRLQKVSNELATFSSSFSRLPTEIQAFTEDLFSLGSREKLFSFFWQIILILGSGLTGYLLVQRITSAARGRLQTRDTESFWDRCPTLLARTIIDLLPPVTLLVLGMLATKTLGQPSLPVAASISEKLLQALFWVAVIMAFSRMFLTPVAANLRLVKLSDLDANYLFIWIRRLTYVAIFGVTTVNIAQDCGLKAQPASLGFKIVGLFLALMVAVLILQCKARVAEFIAGKSKEAELFLSFRRRFAAVWHVLALFYVSALFIVWALEIERGSDFLFRATIITLLTLVLAVASASALSQVISRVFALKDEVKARYPGLESRTSLYVPLIQRIGNILIVLTATIALLEAWGVDVSSWISSSQGQSFLSSLFTVSLLIVITVIIWEVVSALVERYLTEASDISSRAKTLLPLLRTTLLVILSTLVILVTLSEMGLNIGPLLAGAGVVGLAVGFGAQTLVKDIITGVFILTEDQIAVGDVVRIGSHSGFVEQLSLRTIRLRDVAGNVHIVPFSEVSTVENMTKEFSRYLFEIGVAYREDTDQVTEILHEIGRDMEADEVYGPMIVEPLEVLGVDSFGDNAVNIRARITTQPIMQWRVGREFNRRMKKRFDELSIEMPFPHRTIYFGVDKAGNAPEGRVAIARSEHTEAPKLETKVFREKRKNTSDTPMPGSGDLDQD